MNKKTAIEKFKELYGDKYDYSKIGNITSTSDKITIVCPKHGEFVKTVNNHLHGQGCPKCKIEERIKNGQKEFERMGNKIHNGKYNYNKSTYKGYNEKVCIICPIHGEFWQTPSLHISQKCGCPKCANKNKELNEVIEKCIEIHGDKYDYSLIESPILSKKQKIKCKNCGRIFEIDLGSHIHNKRGCKFCSHRSYVYTTDEFKERAYKVHGDKYDYSKSECKGVDDKVCIICPIHGEFWQTPHSHMSGVGCPKCHEEHNINEMLLFDILKKYYGEEVICQYKTDWLKGQSIDIYIPSKKVGIEYQGIQHFKPVKYFGGNKKYEYTVKKDKEKFEKCKNNGIKLFYFSKEKEVPNQYLDTIYSNNNDLINEINKYGT